MAMWFRCRNHIKTATVIGILALTVSASLASPEADTKGRAQQKISTSKWKPEDGWKGIVPGKDKLPKAIALLGKPSKIDKREAIYYFKNGLVEIDMGDRDGNMNLIGRIVVKSEYPGEPKTEKEASTLYDPLDGSERIKPDDFRYKRKGLAIYMRGSENRKVLYMDFHDPKLDEDLKF